MRALFSGSCAKEPDRPEGNEDAYLFSPDRQRLALSDGASESYDSRIWARLLASNYAENPHFDRTWLQSAVADYALQHDLTAMSWSQQLSFERGCFATLLAVEHDATNRRLALFGVGDSVAVFFEGDSFAFAWPLNDAERFRERPTLLSTIPEHNEFALAPEFESLSRLAVNLSSIRDPTLLCMTDALGEWTLRMARDEPERLAEILAIRTEERLAAFVIAERAEKRMRIDDSTLAILKFDDGEDAVGLPQS